MSRSPLAVLDLVPISTGSVSSHKGITEPS